jgi:hydrogenase maturation factor HypF (carbamoyltransferase family)
MIGMRDQACTRASTPACKLKHHAASRLVGQQQQTMQGRIAVSCYTKIFNSLYDRTNITQKVQHWHAHVLSLVAMASTKLRADAIFKNTLTGCLVPVQLADKQKML